MGKKVTEVVVGVIMIMIAFIMFPLITDSTHDVQTDPQTDAFAAVVTGVGVTDADVVLTEDAWQDDAGRVTVTSDNVLDTPVSNTYTPATNTLNVTGLNASDTRTLTVVYDYDATTDFTGLGSIVGMSPLIIFVMLIFGGGLAIFDAARGRR